MTEERLGRIETRLDDVAKTLEILARVEERTTTLFNQNNELRAAVKEVGARVAALELSEVRRANVFRVIDVVLLAIAAAAGTYLFNKLGGFK